MQRDWNDFSETLKRFAEEGVYDFGVFASNPLRLEKVYSLSNFSLKLPAHQETVKFLMSDERIAQVVRDRYLPTRYDLADLIKLPVGTLGYEYASFMYERGYKPDFFELIDVTDASTYIELRLRATHDIWHLVAGFDTSWPGEMGVTMFYVSQMRYPTAVMLVAASFFWCIDHQEFQDDVINAVCEGWKRGKNAEPFLAQRWEDGWDIPLADWRRRLNLQIDELSYSHRDEILSPLMAPNHNSV